MKAGSKYEVRSGFRAKGFADITKDVVANAGSGDELSKKIYRSYEQFRASIMDWTDISERAIPNGRSLA